MEHNRVRCRGMLTVRVGVSVKVTPVPSALREVFRRVSVPVLA